MISLAFVLGVSPGSLLTTTSDQAVRVTPVIESTNQEVWDWLGGAAWDGLGALGLTSERSDRERRAHMVAQDRFHDEACPDFVVAAESRVPGLRALRNQISFAQYLAALPCDVDELLEELTFISTDAIRLMEHAFEFESRASQAAAR